MTANVSQKAVGTEEQYSLAKILGIWAIVSLPMVLLTRVVVPGPSAPRPHASWHSVLVDDDPRYGLAVRRIHVDCLS